MFFTPETIKSVKASNDPVWIESLVDGMTPSEKQRKLAIAIAKNRYTNKRTFLKLLDKIGPYPNVMIDVVKSKSPERWLLEKYWVILALNQYGWCESDWYDVKDEVLFCVMNSKYCIDMELSPSRFSALEYRTF